MSEKFVYQNARIKSMETKLLTAQSVQRLFDCTSMQAAFRTLIDMGFGSGVNVESGDFDRLFEAEEAKQVSFLKEFNVDGTLNVFLMQYDYLNLKILLKAYVSAKPAGSMPPNGLYLQEEIKEWIESEKDIAPGCFKEAIADVKRLAADNKATPHTIDTIVDKAMYRQIFSVLKKGLLKKYFVLKADIANLSAFLRCKRLSLSKEYFEDSLIQGGELKSLSEYFEKSDEELKDALKGTVYFDAVLRVLDGGSITAFEVAMDNLALKLWKDEKNDMFSVAPIVAYYLSKVTELKVAKLIVAGIKNNVEPEIIRERMRDVYA